MKIYDNVRIFWIYKIEYWCSWKTSLTVASLYQKVINEQSKQSDPTIQRKDNNRIPTENTQDPKFWDYAIKSDDDSKNQIEPISSSMP